MIGAPGENQPQHVGTVVEIAVMRRRRLIGRLLRLIIASVLASLATVAVAANDQEALIALGYCKEMEQFANTLVSFTETKCIPSVKSEACWINGLGMR